MHKDTLYNALKEPYDNLPKVRDELVELTQLYPWFQTAHVLLCKADQVSGHHAYEQHLKKAAVYSMDRAHLYRLIMQEKLDAAIERIEEEILSMDEVVEEVISPSIADKNPSTEPDVDGQVEATSQVTEEREDSQEVPEVSSTPEKNVKSSELDDLQRQILVDAIHSSIEKEVSVQEEDVEAVGQESFALPGEDNAITHQDEFSAEEDVTQAPEIQPVVADAEELSPFTRWVMERARSLNYISEIQLSTTSEIADKETPRPTAKRAELIDKFIQTDPKITPRKLDQYEAPQSINAGLIEDDEFMTETLAQIYAKQGNLGKARKAYKLLSLKYPEKSIYFANQIKKLDQLKRK